MDEKIYVLDSTIFIEGGAQKFQDLANATVYEVLDEVKNNQSAIELDRLMRLGLAVIEPEEEFVEAINKIQQVTKDKLSKTDIKVLALAQKFKMQNKTPVVVSDDYAIQNICKNLKIEYMPISKKGITKKYMWIKKCKNCGRKIKGESCEFCGDEGKFRPI
ncbi:MAG: hypothetical protein KAS12_06780 [Candidatus Aenigmarchaeota archaeon]|nr:hypothetical protein [Candidatus Aenigmarchaeota archaeon]